MANLTNKFARKLAVPVSGVLGILFMCFLLIAAGCSSAAPPAAPPTDPDSTSAKGSGTADTFGSNSDSDSDDDDDDDDSDSDNASSDNGFNRGGTEIGEDDVLEELQKCVEDGKFFDRFAEEGTGNCTRLALADIDCTEDGVKEHMSESAKTAFKKALNGDFEDFVLDQCLDCEPDSGSKHCEGQDSGKEQVGTKLYFVKEEDGELFGKAILIKARPGK